MNLHARPIVSLRSQRGSVLLISVILILALTIIALGMFNLNSTQTKVATNSADAQIAFQTAESALRQTESSILLGNFSTANFAAGQAGLYVFNPAVAPLWSTVNWSNASAVIAGFQGSSSAPAGIIIELLPSFYVPGQGSTKATLVFRITTRAVGASGGVPVILQSTVQIQP